MPLVVRHNRVVDKPPQVLTGVSVLRGAQDDMPFVQEIQEDPEFFNQVQAKLGIDEIIRGFPWSWGYPNSWMVYKGKSYLNWMI